MTGNTLRNELQVSPSMLKDLQRALSGTESNELDKAFKQLRPAEPSPGPDLDFVPSARAAIAATIAADSDGNKVIDGKEVGQLLNVVGRPDALQKACDSRDLLSPKGVSLIERRINETGTGVLKALKTPLDSRVAEDFGRIIAGSGAIGTAFAEATKRLSDPSLKGPRSIMPERMEGVTLDDVCGTKGELPALPPHILLQSTPKGRF